MPYKSFKLLFVSDKTLREAMDREDEHTAQVVAYHEQALEERKANDR